MQNLFNKKQKPIKNLFSSTGKIKTLQLKSSHSRQNSYIQIVRPETYRKQVINKQTFTFHYAIGRGGFGKVWKVEQKRTKALFALKEMQKLRVIFKKSMNSVMNERKILENLNGSFIVNMNFAFQDKENLYLVLDLKTGGDLRYHMVRTKKFNETQAKFFVCCLLSSLHYIHSKQIIHRDIKPENAVFDEYGYLYLTDFGIARTWVLDNSKDNSGTPGYMAPEVMFRQSHSYSVDYFAVGVILFEIIMGSRPYVGRDRREIRDNILSKQAKISERVEGWSSEAIDFTNKLIQRRVSSRLGSRGFIEITSHPWLRTFDWKGLTNKTMVSPFVPKREDNFDPRNVDWKDEIDGSEIDLDDMQKEFFGYEYSGRKEVISKHKKSSSLI